MAKCIECTDLRCDITDQRTLEGLSNEIFKLRYAANKNESWEQACERTAFAIGANEGNGQKDHYITNYKRILYDRDFIPGGRILRNAGRVKGMLMNCFVLGVDDNIESIGTELYAKALIISKYGGGIGANFTSLRPQGDVLKSQGEDTASSGLVSFLDGLNYILRLIKGGGDRRAAGLALLACWHPSLYKFINYKLKDGNGENFNLSIGITGEFIDAIKKDKAWNFTFNNRTYDTKRAREVWEHLTEHTWKVAEPGLLNLDKIAKENNLYYCEQLSSTNPCGEVPLPIHGSCCLGSINLSNFYNEKKNEVDWKALTETINLAVRFLDNVLDVSYYPIRDIELNTQASRRVGLGTMGLHHLMLKLGIKQYGSEEALEFIDDFYRRFRDQAYMASIELAKERGPFEKFVSEKYIQGHFVSKLPRRVRKGIKEIGIRNATLISIAPTGTTSLLAGTSQGIEPIFSPIYKRKYYEGDNIREVKEMDSLFRAFVLEGKDTSHFVGAYDVTPEQHLEVQTTIQQYVDNAISKTINIRKDYPQKKLSKLLLDHIDEIKGTTVYREGCKGKEILTPCDHKLSKEQLLRAAKA